MRLTIAIVLIAFWASAKAQVNLVPNPSFEILDTCPYNLDQLHFASPWFSPNGNTPDLFNGCSTVGMPQNAAGWQMPRTGNGYAGMGIYNYYYNGSNINMREYIAAPLLDTLKAGKKYCVEFYASRSDSSFWAINRLGLYLSVPPIPNDNQGETINVTPQIFFDTNQILIDDTSWVRVSEIFTANGGERYLYIGNFYGDSQTDTLSHLGIVVSAYYYIDDVAIYEIADCVAGSNTTICYKDSIQLGTAPTPGVSYLWLPAYGLNNPNISNPTASPDTTITYTLSQMECDVVSTSAVTVTVDHGCHTASAIVIPTMLHGDQNIFISGLEKNSKFELYDDRGRLIYSAEDYQNDFWSTNLAAGIYIARLTRPDGEQIAKKICVVR
ncbi:MAG TPA: T9SS type A sorting domain-containing protein [Bacteroidia bacterium]|nr:T9SS type A sorting domain-containing protein [Bacteroidia bacterium]